MSLSMKMSTSIFKSNYVGDRFESVTVDEFVNACGIQVVRSRTGQSKGCKCARSGKGANLQEQELKHKTKEECVTAVRAPKIKVQTNGGSSSLPYIEAAGCSDICGILCALS